MAILKRAFTQDLSLGALSQDFVFQYDVEVIQVLLTASVNITEDFTISYIDTENGTNYDIIIRDRSINNEDDAAELEINFRLRKGDKIRVQCTNANTTGIIYGTLQVEAKV